MSVARRLLVALLVFLAAAAALAVTSTPAQARSSYIVLVPGERGSQVVTVQRYLHVRPTSGYFGPITRAAVVRWQASHGRHQTGMVGRMLWNAARGVSSRTPVPSRSGDRVVALNWGALARCESGGNPAAYNSAGYYGLYQFSRATWRSVGGAGSPARASSGEQTMRAQALFRRAGASPWPVCGRHLFD
jgi:peptidoglycan hydrolase-like protein with peptidoglycan-binding domain